MTAAPNVRDLLDSGFQPLPLPRGKKKPAFDGWPGFRADLDDLSPFDGMNVGLLLGEPSGGLVDVDLDCPEAVAAADALLPGTGMVSGRAGAPRSHRWYRCADAPKKASEPFDDPTVPRDDPARRRLVELRSTGGQTVVAPSVHPSGESVVWHEFAKPAEVSAPDLRRAVAEVAAAALLARHWPGKGARQDAHLALAGGLARSGLTVDRAEAVVRAVAAATGDDEAADRVAIVARTAERVRAGDHATGWTTLGKLLGPRGPEVVAAVQGWVGRPAPKPAPAPPSGPRDARPAGVRPPAAPRYRPTAPYTPFPTQFLPRPWDAYCAEAGRLLNVDAGLTALPLLSALASAVGGKRRIKLGPKWTEPCVIWTCTVAESGGKKSPMSDFALIPVRDRQEKLFAEHAVELAAWSAEHGGRRRKDDPDPPPRPTAKRVMVVDATIEKLATLLQENQDGLLLHRDEMSGWVASFTRYKGPGGGSDESNWLTLHLGSLLSYDRKTGTHLTVYVPNACVSICGGIQPAKLAALMHRGLRDSGLNARILYAMPPKTLKTYVQDDIPGELVEAAERSRAALYSLTPEVADDGRTRPFVVTLAPDALRCWKAFVNEWGVKTYLASGDDASAFAKLEAYAGRFALLHHLTEHAPHGRDREPVTLRSVEAGIGLAKWFADETERVYALFVEPEADADLRRQAEAVERLAARLGGGVTARQLQRANGRRYATAGAAEAALQALVDAGAGTWEAQPNAPGGQARQPVYRPCPTSDMSDDLDSHDDSSDGDAGGLSDSLSDKSPGPPGGAPQDSSTNPDGTCDYGRRGSGAAGDLSDMSDVGHDRIAESGPSPVSPAERFEEGPESTCRTDPTYTLVVSEAGLATVGAAVRASAAVGLDTETTGLSPRTDRVRLLTLATDAGTFLVDCSRVSPAALWDALAGAEVVGHNLAFDLQFLARLGFTLGRVFDTMLASQVLEAGDRTARHGLKDAAARHLGEVVDKTEQTADWSGKLTPAMLEYAAADARLPLTIRAAMAPKLVAAGLTEVVALENAALPPVAWASGCGVGFDRPAWEALAAASRADAARLRGVLDDLCPGRPDLFGAAPRNWDSGVQVREAFAAVGVTLESADDDALAAVAHPLAEALRGYRGAAKLSSTYGSAWLKHVGPDGRVYCRWKQSGTASGRMSSAEPNLQQLPRDVRYRRCFVAPPGKVFVKADYSQIELRLAAKIADDRAMKDAYQRGDDLHALTAKRVLGKADVTKADRQTAKAVNFGLLFGAGAKRLAIYARSAYGVVMTAEQAADYRKAFFRAYPGLKRWHDLAGATGDAAVDTRTVFGRRRSGVVSFTEKLNSPVQGSAADGLKAALALLWDRRSECPTAAPVLFVHDEVVVEVDDRDAEAAEAWLTRAMVDGMAPHCDPVPVEVEASVARTWGG